ncbi:hypothetical protein G3A_01910 [Bacillus sp. 17376]|uniref:EPSX PROTEIN n=1 Tax=Mesobacillus boroniphilus JCM 21738 TaxID=1294265 RepID=W4RS62_9BACI|nr:hypothetical protein [Mesobacillus boroniphilus]ESU34272.1 hypothetical protein G3A_01910 [Bacillus sp. 17376]GAE46922.1 ePSX PROTEIN [Mesobacillus boroniphilus JCM 21738]
MKSLFTAILAFACMFILIWGNFHWNSKTSVSGHLIESKTETAKKNEEKVNDEPNHDVLAYTKNWPEDAVTVFEKALEEERPIKILIVGSEALGDEQSGWAADAKKKLLETYGEDHLDVELAIFDQNSLEFATGSSSVIGEKNADMVIFEPFTLKDNGVVKIEDSIEHLQAVIDETKATNEETVFILTPPHPIYKATFYPVQVDALKDFATENDIAYLDHWEAWPDPMTAEINDYLTDDQSQPNEEGHKIWENFVVDYLISE